MAACGPCWGATAAIGILAYRSRYWNKKFPLSLAWIEIWPVGELLTQHRMSVGREGGFLDKNFEIFCRKKLCKQLYLISVSAQMWMLVVCKVCSGRGQSCNSIVMDTGGVLLFYIKKIWTGQNSYLLPVEVNSEHWLASGCGRFNNNKCVYFMLPVMTQLEALWKEIVLDLFVEKLSKIQKLREERKEEILWSSHH